ncbi:hypothetical protein [Streptomyces sp. NPDC060194]|uniref:hypothetical protein n=1 Tax=Streptomyces sp. NPDC060194 TaxID=3347069 RepID=UPI00364710B9
MQAPTQQLTPRLAPATRRPPLAAPAAVPRAETTLPWWAVALPVLIFLSLLSLTVLQRTP